MRLDDHRAATGTPLTGQALLPFTLVALLGASGCVVVQAPPVVSPVERTVVERGEASSSGPGRALSDPSARWAVQEAVGGGTLQAVWAVDAQHAFAAGDGGLVVKTEDAGETWTRIAEGAIDEDLRALQFMDPKTGWALGEGALYATTDGGQTWEASPLFEELGAQDRQEPAFSEEHLFFHFSSYTHGTLTGWGRIYVSEDGGKSWALDPYVKPAGRREAPARQDILGLFPQGDGVIASARLDMLTRGPDGWGKIATIGPLPRNITDGVSVGSFPTAEVGYVVAGVSPAGRKLFKTEDGGAHWEPVSLIHLAPADLRWPAHYQLAPDRLPHNAQLRMVDERQGWLIPGGGSAIGRTANGGKTWTWAKFGLGGVRRMAQMHLLDDQTGYIVAGGSAARLIP